MNVVSRMAPKHIFLLAFKSRQEETIWFIVDPSANAMVLITRFVAVSTSEWV